MADASTSKVASHQPISLAKKLKIIEAVESGKKSKSAVAEEFSVAKSTVTSIVKNKQKIVNASNTASFMPERKRLRLAAHSDIEDALMIWFTQARTLNLPISGPVLQIKARELALSMGYNDFTCSTGWLERFKARHGIVFRKMCGEAGSVTTDMTTDWLLTRLPALLGEFTPENIFNADETGLFWKCLPDKTLTLKGETCSGGKKSKDRITVLVCANMTGSQKLPLLVIGKFARPRCFKNVRTLPVQYESNAKAWMVSDLFSSWLLKLDKRFQNEHRKVAMVVDNCPAHPNVQDALKSITLVFLPPNTTSKLQPCDQGIIQNLKVHYRKYLLIKMITAVEAKEEFSPNLLDCLYTLRLAWENVQLETIKNCFEHCGFKQPASGSNRASDSPTTLVPESDAHLLDRLRTEGVNISEELTFDGFVNVDSAVVTTAALSDEDIAAMVQRGKGETDTENTSELDDSPIPPPPPTAIEAIKCLQVLKRYFESKDPVSGEEAITIISKLEISLSNDILYHARIQTHITDYFQV